VGTTHHRNATPHFAVFLIAIAMAAIVAGMAAGGVSGSDIYGWMGSLAVYGFITCYGLAAVALPVYLKRNHHLTAGTILLSVAAALAMMLALAGTLYPVPDAPYSWLPYMYLVYLGCGTGWFYLNRRSQPSLG
jgi:amino acid transporter